MSDDPRPAYLLCMPLALNLHRTPDDIIERCSKCECAVTAHKASLAQAAERGGATLLCLRCAAPAILDPESTHELPSEEVYEALRRAGITKPDMPLFFRRLQTLAALMEGQASPL